jgi:4-hydroxy-tetrahydrodipicolinate reductase
MPYRVIQWSTGNVGLYSLRQVIDHPELELVGLWAHSPSKVGKDAGTLCDRPATGVKATNDAAALLAMDADCVVYTATADLRPFEAIEEIAGILAAGKNVVSSSVVPLVHPKSFFPEIVERLEDAAGRGARRSSRPGSIPASRTTSCRSSSPASPARGRRSASRRSSTTRRTTSPRCSSRRWASASRSRRSRCC